MSYLLSLTPTNLCAQISEGLGRYQVQSVQCEVLPPMPQPDPQRLPPCAPHLITSSVARQDVTIAEATTRSLTDRTSI